MATRKIYNSTPRNLALSARGVTVLVPRKTEVEIATPTGPRSGPKRGELVVDEDFLGACGEDEIIRHWVSAGELDINGPWPKAPPKPVEAKAPESAIDQDRRIKTAETQMRGLGLRLEAAAQVNDDLKAENERLRAENAKLLDAATAPAGGGGKAAKEPAKASAAQ